MEKASKYPSVENLLHLRNIALEFVKWDFIANSHTICKMLILTYDGNEVTLNPI